MGYPSDVTHALVCSDSPNIQPQEWEPHVGCVLPCRDSRDTQFEENHADVRYASACRRVAADSNLVPPSNDETLAGWEGGLAPAQDAAPLKQTETCEPNALACSDALDDQLLSDSDKPHQNLLYEAVIDIHRRWLMTPRDDLNGQSPRQVLFAKRELIDLDLDSRMNQWSYFLEEPPCLSRDSHSYRFAGFGTHEWVMYYDLVRFLISEAVDLVSTERLIIEGLPPSEENVSFTPSFSLGTVNAKVSETVSTVSDEKSLIALLEELKNIWLSEPHDGYIPADVIDNERRRRPEAMTGRNMVVDEDCPCCKWMGNLSEAGLEITFCHFDGSHMEDEFAFSWCATLEEWEEEQRQLKQ